MTLQVRFDPRATADGKIAGYGSVFDNVDSHGDSVEFGAFSKSLEAWRIKGRGPHMFLMHGAGGNPFTGSDLSVGRWTLLREDRRGLYLEGEILCRDTDLGRQIVGLIRGGVLTGLSIGFRPKKSRPGTNGVKRILTEIDLFEVSLVTEPSNPETFIDPVSATDAAYDKLQAALAAAAGGSKATTTASPTDVAADKVRAAMAAVRAAAGKAAPTPPTTKPKTYEEASDKFGAALARFKAELAKH